MMMTVGRAAGSIFSCWALGLKDDDDGGGDAVFEVEECAESAALRQQMAALSCAPSRSRTFCSPERLLNFTNVSHSSHSLASCRPALV